MTSKLAKLHYRMPTTFGPLPGPRQSFNGHRRNGAASTSVEAFITFKTKQAALVSLLPSGFRFQNTGQDAFISLASKRLDNLEWLGGRGYNLLSFYIHGVQYNPPKGNGYYGTFLPVLWENLADPIISGREELGFPKLFADISITQTENSYAMKASWQGTKFAEFSIKGLYDERDNTSPIAPTEAGIDNGLFLHRDMPSVGRPGVADASYPIFVEHGKEQAVQPAKQVKRFTSMDGQFKWLSHDWQALPTLHHIVAAMAEIPTLTVIACGLTEKVGVADFSTAKRVDRVDIE